MPLRCGLLILAGGFWYARNLITVGNPLPWTSLHGILPTPAAPLQQNTGYSVTHYLTTSGFWSRFAQPALAAGLGPASPRSGRLAPAAEPLSWPC